MNGPDNEISQDALPLINLHDDVQSVLADLDRIDDMISIGRADMSGPDYQMATLRFDSLINDFCNFHKEIDLENPANHHKATLVLTSSILQAVLDAQKMFRHVQKKALSSKRGVPSVSIH